MSVSSVNSGTVKTGTVKSNTSHAGTVKSSTNHILINKYKIALQSVKNKLETCTDLETLLDLSRDIVEIETKIMQEYQKGYSKLEVNKKNVRAKIDKLKRNLNKAESELNQINNSIDVKMNKHIKHI